MSKVTIQATRCRPVIIFVLAALLPFLLSTNAFAQRLQVLHSFASWTDGELPASALTLGDNGELYGTCLRGGTFGTNGTIFKISASGSFTPLFQFSGTNGALPSRLVRYMDGTFYGTTAFGGSNYGTVFGCKTNGQVTTLFKFNGINGNHPASGLTVGLDGNLYGTTENGGELDLGTVFRISTNGEFITLASFAGTNGAIPVNSDLVQGSDGSLYGTTQNGGPSDAGTIFRVTTNGTLTSLYSFTLDTNGIYETGAFPAGGLVQRRDGDLYGTAQAGGDANQGIFNGTIFRISTEGVLKQLFYFEGTNGGHPLCNLTIGPDGNLYGTTANGGTFGSGAIFKLGSDSNIVLLASFGGPNGASPNAGLVVGSDGNLYGTTLYGGAGYGTLFRFWLAPEITLVNGFNSVSAMFSYLFVGTNYQLQASAELTTWTNQGAVFAATNSAMIYPQAFDFKGSSQLFFRLQVAP